MGRLRGRLTTKIHALVDAAGRPILLKVTVGQAHDGRSAVDMLATVGPGQTLLADRGYDANYLREPLAARGAVANIKPMPIVSGSPLSTGCSIESAASWSGSSTISSSSSSRHPLRQDRRQLPRLHPPRSNPYLPRGL